MGFDVECFKRRLFVLTIVKWLMVSLSLMRMANIAKPESFSEPNLKPYLNKH